MRVMRRAGVIALLAAVAGWAPAAASAAGLSAGGGKADITPRTGYYLGGWTRQDRVAQGQHTRLWARALVLQRGERKVALVAIDLFMVPGGLVKHVGDALASRGFSESNLLVSASHTHSGPGGYANFRTFNTAAPSPGTASDPLSFYRLLDAPPADPQLYSFLVRQVIAAVRRADADRAPAEAGWGAADIHGLTRNRSIEAHLANHGIQHERGQGSASEDPEGVDHTIDPRVNVLRVDKLVRGRRVPIGGWSTFADHGTVTKSSFQYYNQDHHASALQVFERGVRRAGRVSRRQAVLNVYGNSNEGDQSAGLVRDGPAASDYVGRVEAAAMLRAWRGARATLSAEPELDVRWTRTCFCGQATEGGNVADYAMIGFPFLTGSEEERGPLFDVTRVPLEGVRNPLPVPGQGHKLGIPLSASTVPKAVPLTVLRVADGVIVTLPGEPTTEVGARVRAAVRQATGLDRVVVSGLAREFIQYLTTPEEYDRQHYEGGSTLYGPLSSNLLRQELAELGRRLVSGEPAQAAYPLDPTNGCRRTRRPTGPAPRAGRPSSSPRRCAASSMRPSAGAAGPTASTGRSAARSWSCSGEAGGAGGPWTATSGSACSGGWMARAPIRRSGRCPAPPRRGATGSRCMRSATSSPPAASEWNRRGRSRCARSALRRAAWRCRSTTPPPCAIAIFVTVRRAPAAAACASGWATARSWLAAGAAPSSRWRRRPARLSAWRRAARATGTAT